MIGQISKKILLASSVSSLCLSVAIGIFPFGKAYADITLVNGDFPRNQVISTAVDGNITINTTNAINPELTVSGPFAVRAEGANTITINNGSALKIISQNTSYALQAAGTSTIKAMGDITIDFQSAGGAPRGVGAVNNGVVEFYKNLTISSSSANAIGVMTYSSGNIAMKDSASTLTINLSGNNAFGIVGQTEQPTANQSFVSDAKVVINLTGGGTNFGISTQALGGTNQGLNAKSTMTFNNDVAVTVDHGVALDSFLKNGVISFNAKSSFISKDSEVFNAVQNSAGTINIAGETQVIGDMFMTGADSHTKIDAKMIIVGAIGVTNHADLTMTAKSGSLIKAAINATRAQISLALATGAEWDVTGGSKFQTLDNQGKVVFVDNGGGTFTELSVDTLSGNGTIVMNADIVGQVGDKLIATNSSGAHRVTVVNNGGLSTNGTESFDMITTGDGNATFTGTNKVELGGYEYQFGRSTADSKNWGIYGGTATTGGSGGSGGGKITTTANAAASYASAGYLMSYIDTQMLMARMGELRNNPKAAGGDFWVRGFGGKINAFSVGKIAGFDMSYGGSQLGVDKAFDVAGGVIYGGVALSYASANPDYWGGDGNFKSYQASLYATYLADSGYYVDGILKYIHQKNKFDVRDSAGANVHGDASSDGWGLSVEAGKRFALPDQRFYVEPQVQLSYSSIGNSDTHASNGLQINIDDTDSLLGRIGGTFGYKLDSVESPTHLYAKAYYVHEFNGDVDYRLNGNHEGHSFEGNWGDFAVGFNTQIMKQHNLYGEIHYTTGEKFDDTRLNAGYRFQF